MSDLVLLDDVRTMNARIKETYPHIKSELFPEGMEPDLESVCCDLVNKFLVSKDTRSLVRRRICHVKGGYVLQWPARLKPTEENMCKVEVNNPGIKLLNRMSLEDACNAITAAAEEVPA